MDKVITVIGATVLGIVLVAVASLIGGTIVYWIWPHAVPVVLPGLVATGVIAAKLAWWKAVLFTWLCQILFKGAGNSSSK